MDLIHVMLLLDQLENLEYLVKKVVQVVMDYQASKGCLVPKVKEEAEVTSIFFLSAILLNAHVTSPLFTFSNKAKDPFQALGIRWHPP